MSCSAARCVTRQPHSQVSYSVRLAPAAQEHLLGLLDFPLERAQTPEDPDLAQDVIKALRQATFGQLAVTPGVGRRSIRRALIALAGATGYFAVFEIGGPTSVLVLAVRRQLEQDYH